uniref:G_PROTEIN_RECEP_F1_2 domain-containing protein n=1 Tax=Heterorhabditis bacteriophora TaxID=37862 RepID=A0A1I7WTA9_HETBA
MLDCVHKNTFFYLLTERQSSIILDTVWTKAKTISGHSGLFCSIGLQKCSMADMDIGHNNSCTFYEWSRNPQHAKFFRIFSIISVLTVLVVVVVLGNALVIAAVLLRRRLRSATGLLILSLGVADLLYENWFNKNVI